MSKARAFSNLSSPLTPPIFYILLSLAVKDRHGYDIMKQVALDTQNKIKLGPGTLYGAIKRLLEDKLIIEVNTAHSRRKYYKLTEKGKTIFSNELQRYNEALELAKKRKLILYPILTKFVLAYV